MPLERSEFLRRCADIGFHYRFPEYKLMLVEWQYLDTQKAAEEAERAIAKVE